MLRLRVSKILNRLYRFIRQPGVSSRDKTPAALADCAGLPLPIRRAYLIGRLPYDSEEKRSRVAALVECHDLAGIRRLNQGEITQDLLLVYLLVDTEHHTHLLGCVDPFSRTEPAYPIAIARNIGMDCTGLDRLRIPLR